MGRGAPRDILLGKSKRRIGEDRKGWPPLLRPEARVRPVITRLYDLNNTLFFRGQGTSLELKDYDRAKKLNNTLLKESEIVEPKIFDEKLRSHLRPDLIELTEILALNTNECEAMKSAVRPYVFGDRNGVRRETLDGDEVFVSGRWVKRRALIPLFNSVGLDNSGAKDISKLLLETDEDDINYLIEKGYVTREGDIIRPSQEFAYLILFST